MRCEIGEGRPSSGRTPALSRTALLTDRGRLSGTNRSSAALRKSRHRRIKKRRRYERLAATSQLSLWCTAPVKLPNLHCPGAGHARQSRALDTRSESPLGARLPASPARSLGCGFARGSRIPLVRTSSKSAARRQPRRPAGGPRERVPAGAVAGEIREKGPARVQSRRRRPPYPIPSTGPPSTRRRTPPRAKPPPRDAEAPETRAARGGPRTALPAAERGGRRGDCSPSRGTSPAPLRTPARPTPALRANPYPEVTDLICRLPLTTLF
ncbi:hypothetical protein Q8A73_023973 [Channa argus]|nr:hypothetical protein Q8A73_023973 [Channa argus]